MVDVNKVCSLNYPKEDEMAQQNFCWSTDSYGCGRVDFKVIFNLLVAINYHT